ncbi:FecR family protein [Acetobacter malorum]|uniref:FecR family protein n=1 Tax=Acetobacter malorum TaxID=178901 RepID=UPI0039EB6FF6
MSPALCPFRRFCHRLMMQKTTATRAAALWQIKLQDDPNNPELLRQFDIWLKADPCHPQAWADVSRTITLLQQASRERRYYKIPPAPTAYKPVWKRRVVLGWAGGVAALACVGMVLFAPDAMVWVKADYSTGYSQTKEVQLQDGSVVQLAPRSAVAIQFTKTSRAVTLLRGQALFTVQHNAQVPFTVKIGAVTATDLGTVFDVAMDDHHTTVAVKEGSSRVSAPGILAAYQDLYAGDWLRVTGHVTQTGKQNPEMVGAWATGLLVARAMRVADFVTALRPWSQRHIFVLDKQLAEKRVTGVYNVHDPMQALRLAVRPHGGNVQTVLPDLALVTGPG